MKFKKSSLNKAITATLVFAVVSAIIETMQGGVDWSEFFSVLIVFFVLFYVAFEFIRRKKQERT